MNTNPRIDDYIAKAKPFAKPILIHLRGLIHATIPEITENIKWSFTAFDYKGPLCTMAAFKEHVAFGFWKHVLLEDPNSYLQPSTQHGGNAMGHLGRITSLKSLPPDKIICNFLIQAKQLNDDGIKLPSRPKKTNAPMVIPEDFQQQLQLHPLASKGFEKLSASHQREYLEWICEAKMQTTRERRIKQTLQWLEEGKSRNWKYERK